ncbi:MAG: hypothetical protein IKM09_03875, partial [Clostridia bacterium]|nr:hypothetical protein [Clostridia bacterium]
MLIPLANTARITIFIEFFGEIMTGIAVVGVTASGKSELAVLLAKRHSGEVISCDSMLVYRGCDIGTAKPSLDEMGGIKHHLVDILDP